MHLPFCCTKGRDNVITVVFFLTSIHLFIVIIMHRFNSPYSSKMPKRNDSDLTDITAKSDVSTQSFSIPGIRGPPTSSFAKLSSIRTRGNSTIPESITASACLQTDSTSAHDAQTTTNAMSNPEKPWICAISEGNSTGKELGIAMRNIETGHCFLSQV